MPIVGRWRRVDALPAPRGRDAMPGVYEIADVDKRTIYIGQSARDVPNRIRQHLKAGGCVAERAVWWRYAHSRIPKAHEADLLAAYRTRHSGALPPCNAATPRSRSAHARHLERMRGES